MTPVSHDVRERSVVMNPHPAALYDVVDLMLDKGMVLDGFAHVSVLGIELLTVDARAVVASFDTYLRFAEATDRVDLAAVKDAAPLPRVDGRVSSP